MKEIEMVHTHVRDEGLMDCVGHQGNNDLYAVRFRQEDCSLLGRTTALVPRSSFLL